MMVIVALVLGAYFLFFDTATIDNGDPSPSTPNQLGQLLIPTDTLTPATISSITLTTNNQPPITILQNTTDNTWRQTTPVNFPINTYNITDLITQTSNLHYTSTITPSPKLTGAQLGLDPPHTTATFNINNASPITLQLGARSAAGLAYIKFNNTVYVVNDALHNALLNTNLTDWRDKSLATFTPGQPQSINLTTPTTPATPATPATNLQLTKTDNRWSIVQPESGITSRADRAAVEQLAQTLASATITQFIKDNPTDLAIFGLTQPTATLTLQIPNPTASTTTTHTLTVGAPQNIDQSQYFATYNNTPVVFTLPKMIVDQLLQPIDHFRDKKITPLSRPDVNAITIKRKNTTLAFKWVDANWTFTTPQTTYPPDQSRVTALIDAIFNTNATAFIDITPIKLAPPIATLTLTLAGQASPEIIYLHDHSSDQLLALRATESLGHVIPRAPFAAAFDSPLAFRSLTVLDIAQPQLASIHLIRSGAFPANYTLNRKTDQPTQWDLTDLNAPAIQNLLTHIAPLTATRWLNDAPITTPEGVTLNLTLNDSTIHTIHIHTDSLTATLPTSPNAFTITPAFAAALNAELRDLRPLKLDADQIETLTLGPNTLTRDTTGAYTLTGPATLNQTKAATLFNTIASLTAIHYIDTAPTAPPTTTLQITTTNNTQHTLKIWLNPQPTAQLDQTAFTISPTTAKNLTTSPTQ